MTTTHGTRPEARAARRAELARWGVKARGARTDSTSECPLLLRPCLRECARREEEEGGKGRKGRKVVRCWLGLTPGRPDTSLHLGGNETQRLSCPPCVNSSSSNGRRCHAKTSYRFLVQHVCIAPASHRGGELKRTGSPPACTRGTAIRSAPDVNSSGTDPKSCRSRNNEQA
jgi:hypothetical protein